LHELWHLQTGYAASKFIIAALFANSRQNDQRKLPRCRHWPPAEVVQYSPLSIYSGRFGTIGQFCWMRRSNSLLRCELFAILTKVKMKTSRRALVLSNHLFGRTSKPLQISFDLTSHKRDYWLGLRRSRRDPPLPRTIAVRYATLEPVINMVGNLTPKAV
jgi:hypothetical protein